MKKYTIEGLLEWLIKVRVGDSMVEVHFDGGALTKYGSTSAEFATDDAAIQQAIEATAEFRNGRIRCVYADESHAQQKPAEAHPTGADSTGAQQGASGPRGAAKGYRHVEFPCFEAAVTFLTDECGFADDELMNMDDVIAAGHLHGLDIKIRAKPA